MAELQIGLLHYDGRGVETNHGEALKWIKRAGPFLSVCSHSTCASVKYSSGITQVVSGTDGSPKYFFQLELEHLRGCHLDASSYIRDKRLDVPSHHRPHAHGLWCTVRRPCNLQAKSLVI